MSRLQPHDPTFHCLLEILWHLHKLDHLGLRLVQSLPSATPESNLNIHNWDGYPAHELTQIRTLSFFHSQDQFLHRDIVGPRLLSSRLPCLTQSDRT